MTASCSIVPMNNASLSNIDQKFQKISKRSHTKSSIKFRIRKKIPENLDFTISDQRTNFPTLQHFPTLQLSNFTHNTKVECDHGEKIVFPILQGVSVPFKNDLAAQSTEHSET